MAAPLTRNQSRHPRNRAALLRPCVSPPRKARHCASRPHLLDRSKDTPRTENASRKTAVRLYRAAPFFRQTQISAGLCQERNLRWRQRRSCGTIPRYRPPQRIHAARSGGNQSECGSWALMAGSAVSRAQPELSSPRRYRRGGGAGPHRVAERRSPPPCAVLEARPIAHRSASGL